MGNEQSQGPIRNLDKRTARRRYKDDFLRAISDWRAANLDVAASPDAPVELANNERDVHVFLRKRPIHPAELKTGEFDVITCGRCRPIIFYFSNCPDCPALVSQTLTTTLPPLLGKASVTLHDARMHSDMQRQIMRHHEFLFDGVFDEFTNSTEVSGTNRPTAASRYEVP